MNFKYKDEAESYTHYMSKLVLGQWLSSDYKIEYEKLFKINNIMFVPDITCLIDNQVICIYEVVNKNDLDKKKLSKIQMYQYYSGNSFNVYSIYSSYILEQKNKPDKLIVFDFTTKFNESMTKFENETYF